MHRPTPAEIAELISEDIMGTQPVSGLGVVNQGTLPQPGPEVQMAPPSQVQDAVSRIPLTTMQACSASSCAHNVHGERCELDEIEIDDRGHCAMFELAECDEQEEPNGSRYNEHQVEVGEMPMVPAEPTEIDAGEGNHWVTNKWDPQGNA